MNDHKASLSANSAVQTNWTAFFRSLRCTSMGMRNRSSATLNPKKTKNRLHHLNVHACLIRQHHPCPGPDFASAQRMRLLILSTCWLVPSQDPVLFRVAAGSLNRNTIVNLPHERTTLCVRRLSPPPLSSSAPRIAHFL